ncbi:hypothetical protein [Nocardiopsis sp. LOL_012]|uniref:hypothetical protein n=1 Tax=Nocardiopsis sp. LOL_012 TaxID=3345409 RepID=UPI003A83C285
MKGDFSMLSREIDLLFDRLNELQVPAYRRLIPGVDASRVKETLGAQIPDPVVTWFGRINGIEFHSGQTQEDADIVPGYSPVGLGEVVEDYKNLREEDPVLGEFWVPILQGRGGDFYAAVWGIRKSAAWQECLQVNLLRWSFQVWRKWFHSSVNAICMEYFLLANLGAWK